MSTSHQAINCGSARTVGHHPWQAHGKATWWSQRREASLNWLALGVLLAAWNVSDDGKAPQLRRRPDALRGYSSVSVRAATLHFVQLRASSTNP